MSNTTDITAISDSSLYIKETEDFVKNIEEFLTKLDAHPDYSEKLYAIRRTIDMAKLYIEACPFKINDRVRLSKDYEMIVNENDWSYNFKQYSWAQVVGIRPGYKGYVMSIILDYDWHYTLECAYKERKNKYIYSIPVDYLEKITIVDGIETGMKRIHPSIVAWQGKTEPTSEEETGSD